MGIILFNVMKTSFIVYVLLILFCFCHSHGGYNQEVVPSHGTKTLAKDYYPFLSSPTLGYKKTTTSRKLSDSESESEDKITAEKNNKTSNTDDSIIKENKTPGQWLRYAFLVEDKSEDQCKYYKDPYWYKDTLYGWFNRFRKSDSNLGCATELNFNETKNNSSSENSCFKEVRKAGYNYCNN